MAKNRRASTSSGRRSTNVTPSRHHYPSPTYRLHARPSPSAPDYTRPLIGRTQYRRPPTPQIADNRVWKPVQFRQTVFGYSGAPSGRTRLYDAPRASRIDPVLAASSRPMGQKALKRQAQVNRWGIDVDRKSRATLVFAESHRLPLCDQRKERREVLHAKGVAGSRVRRPRFKPHSEIGCR